MMKGNNIMNVSSIIVKTSSENMKDVIDKINSMEYCETHYSDPNGKIVVTIEGKSIDRQMSLMKKIINMPSVYGASLAYSYCEDELSDSLNNIKRQSQEF